MNKSYVFLLFLLFSTSFQAHAIKRVLSFSKATAPSAVLTIKGENNNKTPVMLIIRIDDSLRPSYAQRANIERMIAPGPFDIQLTLANTLKSDKTPLDLSSLRQIIIFSLDNKVDIDIKRLSVDIPPEQTTDVLAWDFGAKSSPVWPQFTRVTPQHSALSGRYLTALQRDRHFSITEGLITDGIKGIEKITLPPTTSPSKVTLFIHDMGDWEYTPRILSRVIKANNKTVYEQQINHRQWLNQHYLKGKDEVFNAQTSVFHSLITPHYEPITFVLAASTSEHVISFHGNTPEAGFVSGIVVEPANDTTFSQALNDAREQWWKRNWPIDLNPKRPQSINQVLDQQAQTLSIDMAQDSNEFLVYQLNVKPGKMISNIKLVNKHRGSGIQTELRQSRWQLRRERLKSNVLQPSAQYLTQPYIAIPSSQYPTLLSLRLTTTASKQGQYPMELQYQVGNELVTHALLVNVLDTRLPEITKHIGVYTEQSPHHLWESKAAADLSVQCDLAFFRELGLSSIAPGFTTPHDARTEAVFLQELKEIQNAGMNGPILAYTPFKRLVAKMGFNATITRLNDLSQKIKRLGLPEVLWSVADEPSNADSEALSSLLQNASLTTAGHFNHPDDHILLDYVTAALVNEGVMETYQDLADWTKKSTDLWLYNITDSRYSAGYLSWYYPVKGYLQWHARMPTALPFSPIDGREDDVQFLYPQLQTCPSLYNVDEGLFIFAQGIDDHRWLLWLDKQATTIPQASQLKQNIIDAIDSHKHTNTFFPAQRWTDKIKTLAKHITQGSI